MNMLRSLPNILCYTNIFETERAGYAVRQFLNSSLYDRISTRPFLSVLEKKWICYQLLAALVDAHMRQAL
jgi:phosphoinositide-3-kinase regulatory subunit 4